MASRKRLRAKAARERRRREDAEHEKRLAERLQGREIIHIAAALTDFTPIDERTQESVDIVSYVRHMEPGAPISCRMRASDREMIEGMMMTVGAINDLLQRAIERREVLTRIETDRIPGDPDRLTLRAQTWKVPKT